MIRVAMAVAAAFIFASVAAGAEVGADGKGMIPLWEGQAPGAKGNSPDDVPAIQPYFPEKPTGSAIVVCPGGGYGGLAPHEAGVVGEWLAKSGSTASVLRYRLGRKGYHHPIDLGDGARASRP